MAALINVETGAKSGPIWPPSTPGDPPTNHFEFIINDYLTKRILDLYFRPTICVVIQNKHGGQGWQILQLFKINKKNL